MIGQTLWKSLKSLVNIDREIKEVKAEADEASKIIKQDEQEIPKLENEIKESEKILLNKKKEVALLELRAKELKEREQLKKNTLN